MRLLRLTVILYLFLHVPLLAQQCGVVINEVMVSPTSVGSPGNNSLYFNLQPTQNKEWIELYNKSTCDPIDISCWILASNESDPNGSSAYTKDNHGAFVFPAGTIIPPMGFLVIGGGGCAIKDFDLSTDTVIKFCSFNKRWFLYNEDGWIALYDKSGTPVDAVYWTKSGNAGDLNTQPAYANQVSFKCNCLGTPTTLAAIKDMPSSVINFAGEGPHEGFSLPYPPCKGFMRTYDGSTTWIDEPCASSTPKACNAACAQPLSTIPGHTDAGCSNPGSAQVTASNGTPSYTYTWTNTGLTTSSINNVAAGTYTVTVTDACSCTKSETITIGNNGGIALQTNKTDISCGSTTGSASVTPSGGSGNYSYTWNGTGQATQTANNLSAGNYTVTVNDLNANCTATALVNITQQAGFTVNVASTNPNCSNVNGSATATPSGALTYSYSWSNGQLNQTATNLSAGTYTVTVTDANQCSTTKSITLTAPQPFTFSGANTPASCGNNNGSASATNIIGGTGPFNYSWSTNPVQNNQTATGLAPGIYTVVITDQNNCTSSKSITVGQQGNLTVNAIQTPTQCSASNGTATATITGGGTPTYTWSTTPVQNTATATGLNAGIYTVTVTDNSGCSSTTTIEVLQQGNISVSIPTVPPVCPNQQTALQANITGGNGPFTYNWSSGGSGANESVSPVTTTTYTVSVNDVNGCTSSASVTITVNNIPLTVDAGNNLSYCNNGSSQTLTATPTGGNGTLTYSWTSGGQATPSISVTPGTTTSYTITVTDACNQTATDIVTITVDPTPVASFTFTPTPECEQDCIQFTEQSNANGGVIQSYSWTFGDGSSSTAQSPNYCYKNSGIFIVNLTVTSDKGCKHSYTTPINATILGAPTAAFSINPRTVVLVEDQPLITFTDASVGANSWSWNFGDPADATGSTIQNPTHIYSDTGHFCTTLIVSNNLSCTDTAVDCISILPDWAFYIPNTFTPNGDGKNDSFNGKGINIKKYDMRIYDRWGNEIFHTTSLSKNWDGKVQGGGGQVAQQDVYVWLVKLTDVFDKDHQYIGHVTLIK